MPSQDTKILEFNQYQKFDKAPFIIYADLECLKEKVDGCKNNLKSSFITKDGTKILNQVFQFLQYIENKYDVYRCNNWMKKFCEFLRELTMKIINFKKKN